MVKDVKYCATGRRKESTARVILKSGSGEFMVNKRLLESYFGREVSRMLVKQPLIVANVLNKLNVSANVSGGGLSGQAGAICHGIARALLKYDESLKPLLRKGNFLTRDSRMKERKKPGQKGARARFQWTKR
ncbi:MAG: 30S ribosomal protein S9 [Candidatus Omnitrophica bacterium]|nr:30S ribosomal protein S9 [Candidatus Omnitrophota bacterium]